VGQANPDVAPLLTELFKAQAIEIYVKDPVTGNPKSLRLLRDEELDLFINKIEDVAIGINEVLNLLTTPGRPAQDTGNRAIYLAEAPSELRNQRDTIWRELVERGYKVLPNEPLPSTPGEFERMVAHLLRECRISIHLVGSNYETVLGVGNRSATETQHDLAAQSSAAADLFRFIWLPQEFSLWIGRLSWWTSCIRD
jgi:hypothetical protein